MAVVPSGSISLPQHHLKTMLANCAAFQTWTSTVDVAAALEKIYINGWPEPANNAEYYSLAEHTAYRPCAKIFFKRSAYRADSVGVSFGFANSGELLLQLVQTAPEVTNDNFPTSDAETIWENSLGAILDELWALPVTSGYLAIAKIADVVKWCGHPDDAATEGVCQGADATIEWGAI